MAGISSRTRSKNVPLFGCLPPKSKRRRRSDEEPFVIFIDGDDDGDEDMYFDSASDSKNMMLNEEPFVVPEGDKVISIEHDDYGDQDEEGSVQQCDENFVGDEDNPISIHSDEYGESDEEHSNGSDSDVADDDDNADDVKDGLQSDADADDEKEEKSYEFDEKDENFVGEKSGCDEEHYGSDSDAADADEVKDGVKSDADADVKDVVKMDADDDAGDVKDGVKSDEVGGNGEFYDKDKSFIDLGDSDKSDSDDSDESEDSGSDESEEIETSDEDFRVDEMNEILGNDDDNSSSSSYVNEKEEEEEEEEKKKKKKTGGPKYYSAVEELVREVMDRQSGISERNNEEVNVENSPSSTNIDELEHEDHASVSSCTIEKKGSSSSQLNGVSETLKPKSVEGKAKNLSDESVNVEVNAKSKNKSKENVGDSDRGKYQFVKGLDVGGISSVQKKQEEMKNESIVLEFKYDAVDRRDRQPPPVPVETPPSIWSFKKVGKVQKTKEDEENNVLQDELETTIRESKVVSKNETSEGKKTNYVKGKDNAKPKDSVNVGGKKNYVKGLGVGGVSSVQTKQEEMKESDKEKMTENKGRDYKGVANIPIEKKKKKESIDNSCLNQSVKSPHFTPKELRSLELLAQCYWERKNTMNKDSIVLEVNEDCVDRQDTQPPPVSVDTPHERIWSLKKVEKVEKTKEEEENEVLWDELETTLRELEAVCKIGNLETDEASGSPSSCCEHNIFLDEEIGEYCKSCGVIITEIKYISPLVIDRFPHEGYRKRASFDDSVNASLFDGSKFNVSDGESETNFSHNEGTVWDLIPDDVKETSYPHQKEGFEFIWKNLTGHIDLHKLSKTDPRREGGCIISHAPGTGKTRLTIMFLMSYLKVFPKCLPVIVAPAGLLLTWEDEFKKWDVGVPFHNLNNLELSGKEHGDAVNLHNWSNARPSKDTTRMVKLISWYKESSILGISYSLYEKLAGGGGECDDEDEKKRKQARGVRSKNKRKKKYASAEKRNGYMRKVLLEAPGLLVFDEGHTPRSEKSLLWNMLLEIQTNKRIILSGTPFQNNFMELYNTLSLMKPSFPNTISLKLKNFCQKPKRKKTSKKSSWELVSGNSSDNEIKQLKLLMDPFVHVHKGAILQKKLPGLRNCILTLKPDSFQKQTLESIKSSHNIFISEPKVTMASVHPSLLLECKLLEEEESVLDKERLEKLRLNPNGGVKTKFLVEFVRLCDAVNEKVLVFSELLGPLRLIKDQLSSSLNWTDKEILYMDGVVRLKEKQELIHSFNDANCQAKILLASTRACSEGISLVGASRVVLLDVVWNPSVERQAVSRAYRIGQKRVVYTYHLLTEGTTEHLKYFKQSEKDRLSELVFSDKHIDNDESKSCAVDFDDKVLDLMLQHEKLKGMFVKCVVQPKERDFVESFGY